jgi:hypothetical protein
MGRLTGLLCACAFALGAAASASASQLVGANANRVTLAVNTRGEALVSFTTPAGARRHVLAWGGLNARLPNPTIPQVHFRVDNAGGWAKYHRLVWQTFRDSCRPYTGPPLVYAVAACTAPDGSYWALQSWQRIQPMRGLPAFKPWHMRWELHLSHWSGPLAVLQVSPNWTYGGMWQGLFGRLLYKGEPVHGFKANTTPDRFDSYGRYFYVDTFDSAWGRGWKRAAGKVTHDPNGGFCYSFVPDRPPAGYPDRSIRPPGNGKRERVTVMGPGVTPDVRWEGSGLGRYDARRDAVFNRLFDEIIGRDPVCAAER